MQAAFYTVLSDVLRQRAREADGFGKPIAASTSGCHDESPTHVVLVAFADWGHESLAIDPTALHKYYIWPAARGVLQPGHAGGDTAASARAGSAPLLAARPALSAAPTPAPTPRARLHDTAAVTSDRVSDAVVSAYLSDVSMCGGSRSCFFGTVSKADLAAALTESAHDTLHAVAACSGKGLPGVAPALLLAPPPPLETTSDGATSLSSAAPPLPGAPAAELMATADVWGTGAMRPPATEGKGGDEGCGEVSSLRAAGESSAAPKAVAGPGSCPRWILNRVGFGIGLVTQEAWLHPEVPGSDAVTYHEGLGHALGMPHPSPEQTHWCVMGHGMYRQVFLPSLCVSPEIKARMRRSGVGWAADTRRLLTLPPAASQPTSAAEVVLRLAGWEPARPSPSIELTPSALTVEFGRQLLRLESDGGSHGRDHEASRAWVSSEGSWPSKLVLLMPMPMCDVAGAVYGKIGEGADGAVAAAVGTSAPTPRQGALKVCDGTGLDALDAAVEAAIAACPFGTLTASNVLSLWCGLALSGTDCAEIEAAVRAEGSTVDTKPIGACGAKPPLNLSVHSGPRWAELQFTAAVGSAEVVAAHACLNNDAAAWNAGGRGVPTAVAFGSTQDFEWREVLAPISALRIASEMQTGTRLLLHDSTRGFAACILGSNLLLSMHGIAGTYQRFYVGHWLH